MLAGEILHDVRRVHVMEQRDTDDFNLSIFTGYIVAFLLTADGPVFQGTLIHRELPVQPEMLPAILLSIRRGVLL